MCFKKVTIDFPRHNKEEGERILPGPKEKECKERERTREEIERDRSD